MQTIEIRAGRIDVRRDATTDRVCLVFEAADASLRLFRTMPVEEARAFVEHCERVLAQ
ncbi:MAG: hypothetical protein H0U66_04740 [Gemmatimonadaceae bacterium]|nr:hypothetical protein [Gemmatimonadaceae bacterium]